MRGTYKCPDETCDAPMSLHTRYFSHGSGRIVVTMETLAKEIPHPDGDDDNSFMMWSWCKLCQQMTPIVPMSNDVCAVWYEMV